MFSYNQNSVSGDQQQQQQQQHNEDEHDEEDEGIMMSASSSNPQDDSVEIAATSEHHDDSPELIISPSLQDDVTTRTRASTSPTTSNNSNTDQLSFLRSRNSNLSNTSNTKQPQQFRSGDDNDSKRACLQREAQQQQTTRCCCRRTTMNTVASVLLWLTVISLAVATVWYSYELFNHGTDPHLIAWFSAGAFVLLGFPISMYGIIGHLANYNAPAVQVYVIRILWMVPIYSIESWLAMRFHKQAVFIETLRDFYESYVLYSFTQFLIEVLGGEEALILMLKDKSPTRGHHMWGLQWCVKPWLMGQPVRRYSSEIDTNSSSEHNGGGGYTSATSAMGHRRNSVVQRVAAAIRPAARQSRVHWTSPFFVKCKFGVLQYVLIKFLCAVAVLILEYYGYYKEGQFHWNAGYLYICILTNVSQCWALYCLIFFYYATKTELSPIRPVGKFLSVKALVFFTWWQSVFISVLYQLDMIPNYRDADERDWSSDAVAKGIQDYLICMEMFMAAVVHTFVFPHTEYSVAAVRARQTAVSQQATPYAVKRLGRRKQPWKEEEEKRKNSVVVDVEMQSLLLSNNNSSWDVDSDNNAAGLSAEDAILMQPQPHHHTTTTTTTTTSALNAVPLANADYDNNNNEYDTNITNNIAGGGGAGEQDDARRPGLFRAFMDSAIPRDLRDNTVNVLKGEYNIEKKTLLHHAATSDQYDLFSKNKRQQQRALSSSRANNNNKTSADQERDQQK